MAATSIPPTHFGAWIVQNWELCNRDELAELLAKVEDALGEVNHALDIISLQIPEPHPPPCGEDMCGWCYLGEDGITERRTQAEEALRDCRNFQKNHEAPDGDVHTN